MKIGVMAESFRLPFKDAIKLAREMGAEGVQIYVSKGDFTPDKLTPSGRRELLGFLSSWGMSISALCGDFGGHGFTKKEENEWKIEETIKIMDLARDLKTQVVTTHIGVVPENKEEEQYKVLKEAMEEVGFWGERKEIYLAIETGPESPEILKDFIVDVGKESIRVNYDPANLVMCAGSDPVKGVFTLGKWIVHTHAKDGEKLSDLDARTIYERFAEGGFEEKWWEKHFRELPLGEGKVNFPEYLKALKEVGYDYFLTVEREVGENPVEDIRKAVEFLNKLLREL
ncbi:sugar phosphate isomerase/epimerase [Candidatus Calescamantes bacterium]|nr:sugar phosphate isomerase/epimerase [Candidatus Calescamantes bacterium]